jgi:hypothetical protein
MTAVTGNRRRREGGQALVVMVAAVIPALLMVGLIVDGGNAWNQQRLTQNAADAASDAGATVLARRSFGVTGCTDSCWDTKVVTAVTQAGQDAGVTIQFCTGSVPDLATSECTYYTDFLGTTPLGLVGTGVIPANTAWVRAFGTLQFGTFFAKIAGIDTFTAAADAIAHFGYSGCSDGSGNNSLGCSPLAFYVNWVGCDKSGKSVVQQPPTEVSGYLNQMIILPICKTTGNWGWLSATDVATKTIPDWFDSDTGKRQSNIMNELISIASDTNPPTILIPIYDCANVTASCPDPSDPANAQRLSDMGGTCNGSNCFYHIVKVGAFELHAVYSGTSICTGQNSTECLWGKFVGFISEGSLLQSAPGYIPGSTGGKGGARGVQLIK